MRYFRPSLLQSNGPFGLTPHGEPILPHKLSFHEWQASGADFMPAVEWKEDNVPLDQYLNVNSLNPRMMLRDRTIMPRLAGKSFLKVHKDGNARKAVATGKLPKVKGVDMNKLAKIESDFKMRFMETMTHRDIPPSGQLTFQPEIITRRRSRHNPFITRRR